MVELENYSYCNDNEDEDLHDVDNVYYLFEVKSMIYSRSIYRSDLCLLCPLSFEL